MYSSIGQKMMKIHYPKQKFDLKMMTKVTRIMVKVSYFSFNLFISTFLFHKVIYFILFKTILISSFKYFYIQKNIYTNPTLIRTPWWEWSRNSNSTSKTLVGNKHEEDQKTNSKRQCFFYIFPYKQVIV